MGNNVCTNKLELDMLIQATKDDIAQDYDLTNPTDISKANTELINSFKKFSKKEQEHVRTQLFVVLR